MAKQMSVVVDDAVALRYREQLRLEGRGLQKDLEAYVKARIRVPALLAAELYPNTGGEESNGHRTDTTN